MIHDEVTRRLGRCDLRYTAGRRAVVDVLAAAGRPLTVPEILQSADARGVPQSSAYRHLTVLIDGQVAHRVAGDGGHDRFELAEDLAGHHHHLLCTSCGLVADIAAPPGLERAVADAAQAASAQSGFTVTGHRVDLVGVCDSCRD